MIGAKLTRFLFSYGATPQTTTGISPEELLMGWQLRSKLDLLHPIPAGKVCGKQKEQSALHDQGSKERLINVGT